MVAMTTMIFHHGRSHAMIGPQTTVREEWGLGHEPLIRLLAFLAVFAVAAAFEAVAPRRRRESPRSRRWPVNLGLALLDVLCVRGAIAFLPVAAVAVAVAVKEKHFGLLNSL